MRLTAALTKTENPSCPKADPITGRRIKLRRRDESLRRFNGLVSDSICHSTELNPLHARQNSYETALMALHDRDVRRLSWLNGIAGLSIAADSLSAIKFATVKPVRDENGIAVDFEISGDYPKFGNNDPRVDDIACDLVERFMAKIRDRKMYRNAIPTQSILTITSNVVYGKNR